MLVRCVRHLWPCWGSGRHIAHLGSLVCLVRGATLPWRLSCLRGARVGSGEGGVGVPNVPRGGMVLQVLLHLLADRGVMRALRGGMVLQRLLHPYRRPRSTVRRIRTRATRRHLSTPTRAAPTNVGHRAPTR